MKSKLTLRLDEDLKERTKRLADERGISVSRLVEDYFRLLLHEPTGEDESSADDAGLPDASGDQPSREDPLSPRIQQMKERLGTPAPTVSMDEDTRQWVEAAAEKHR
jgi:predicted transcriptional regulator